MCLAYLSELTNIHIYYINKPNNSFTLISSFFLLSLNSFIQPFFSIVESKILIMLRPYLWAVSPNWNKLGNFISCVPCLFFLIMYVFILPNLLSSSRKFEIGKLNLCCLAFSPFLLTHTKWVIWEEGASAEKMHLSDWLVGKHFLDRGLIWKDPAHCG